MDPETLYKLGVASRKNGLVTVRECWRCKDEYPEWAVLSTVYCPECTLYRRHHPLDNADTTNRSVSTTVVRWFLN